MPTWQQAVQALRKRRDKCEEESRAKYQFRFLVDTRTVLVRLLGVFAAIVVLLQR